MCPKCEGLFLRTVGTDVAPSVQVEPFSRVECSGGHAVRVDPTAAPTWEDVTDAETMPGEKLQNVTVEAL